EGAHGGEIVAEQVERLDLAGLDALDHGLEACTEAKCRAGFGIGRLVAGLQQLVGLATPIEIGGREGERRAWKANGEEFLEQVVFFGRSQRAADGGNGGGALALFEELEHVGIALKNALP